MKREVVIEDLREMCEAELPWGELDGKTVLVTGATGMLASYVTWLLLHLHEREGIHVSVVALCRNRQKAEQFFGSYIGEPYSICRFRMSASPSHTRGRWTTCFIWPVMPARISSILTLWAS